LENFTGLTKSKHLPPSLCILTDCPELERELLDDKVNRSLVEYEDIFSMMHLSDEGQSSFHNSKKVLRFKFLIPPIEQMERLRVLIKMAIHFIDVVATKKLSAQSRMRALQIRKLAADKLYRQTHTQRQEAYAKRKELKRKDDENATLTPEQQRKKELKEQRALLKKINLK